MTTIFKSREQRFKLLVFFTLYVITPSMILWCFGTDSILFSLSGGFLFGAILVGWTFHKIFRNVPGNRILSTEDTFLPKWLKNLRTNFRQYITGWALTWWWEKDVRLVKTEFDVGVAIGKFHARSEDGDRIEHENVNSTFKVRLNLKLPNAIDTFMALGEDDDEIMEAIFRTSASVVIRAASKVISEYDSEFVTSEIGKISELTLERIQLHEKKAMDEIVSEIVGVNFADFDQSKEVEAARLQGVKLKDQLKIAREYLESLGIPLANQKQEQVERVMETIRINNGDISAYRVEITGQKVVGPSSKALTAAVISAKAASQQNQPKGGKP